MVLFSKGTFSYPHITLGHTEKGGRDLSYSSFIEKSCGRKTVAVSGIPADKAHSGQPPEKYVSGPIVFKYSYFNLFTVTSLVHTVVLCSSETCCLTGDDRPFSIHTLAVLASSPPPAPSLRLSPFLPLCSTAGLLLGLEVFRADFHLHSFQGVGGPMPAVPGDAIQVPVVLSEAVEDPVEVGVCAAVVPIPTFAELCALV